MNEIINQQRKEIADLKLQVEQLSAYAENWKKEYCEEVTKHVALHNKVYSGQFGRVPEGKIYNTKTVLEKSVEQIEEDFAEDYANQLRGNNGR